MKTIAEEPINPMPRKYIGPDGATRETTTTGLTKREYFAAMAIQGILVGRSRFYPPKQLSEQAVEYADALIEELNR